MKKIVIILLASFFIPLYIFIALEASYLSRIYYTGILGHSILLLLICSTAFSISYYCYKHYTRNKTPLFFFLSLFFAIIGASFFFHSIAIPSFYFLNEQIFDITEHLGLFLAGVVLMALFLPEHFIPLEAENTMLSLAPTPKFGAGVNHGNECLINNVANAGFNTPRKLLMGFIKDALYSNKKKIFLGFIFAMILLYAVIFISRDLSKNFSDNINYFIFISGALLVAGIGRILQEREIIFGHANFYYFIAGLSALVNTAVIPFFYKEWNLSWWYFHIVILIAELIIFWGIIKIQKENV